MLNLVAQGMGNAIMVNAFAGLNTREPPATSVSAILSASKATERAKTARANVSMAGKAALASARLGVTHLTAVV